MPDTTLDCTKNHKDSKHRHCRRHKHRSYTITQADIGRKGYVIYKNGKYKLASDILFDPLPQSTLVVISGPGGSGTTATAIAAVSGGIVRGMFVANGGSDYTSAPTVTITGTGTGAQFTANLKYGAVTSFTQVSGGSGTRTRCGPSSQSRRVKCVCT